MWTTALHYRISVSITNILVLASLTKSGSLQSTVWGCCWEPRHTSVQNHWLVENHPELSGGQQMTRPGVFPSAFCLTSTKAGLGVFGTELSGGWVGTWEHE